MTRLIVQNANILTMADVSPSITAGDILISGNRILSVGPMVVPQPGDRVIDASGKLAMPGLINCHNHAAMTHFRAYCDDRRLMDWLKDQIWPAEARLTEEDVYWGTMLCSLELLKSGTTTFADMYMFMNGAARAVKDAGLRGCLARGIVFFDGLGERRLKETEELYHQWNNAAGERIKFWIGPHAPYTCPPDDMRKTFQLAEKLNAPVHIHISETVEEVDLMFSQYKKSPVKYVSDLGLFEHHVLAAHCVNLSRDDLHLMQSMRGGIAHNPVSNMKLACGVAPVRAMRELGITVGLGTDGAGSATTLDMFEEIKLAAWLYKNQAGDPSLFNAYDVLRMATIEGAKVLGLQNEIGTLEAGKKADLILLDLHKPHLVPKHDLVALLAYSANGADVDTVIVDGVPLMAGRQLAFMDENEIMREAHDRALRLVRCC